MFNYIIETENGGYKVAYGNAESSETFDTYAISLSASKADEIAHYKYGNSYDIELNSPIDWV